MATDGETTVDHLQQAVGAFVDARDWQRPSWPKSRRLSQHDPWDTTKDELRIE